MQRSLIDRRALLFAVAGLSAAAVTRSGAVAHDIPTIKATSDNAAGAGSASSLADAAKASRRFFGAAVRPELLSDHSAARGGLLDNCACFTPEIHLKWNSLEWSKGEFNYAPIDDLVSYAADRDLFVRGHTLLWERSTPDWARSELAANPDWNLIAGHFSRTLGRYQKAIKEWDVVNEPLDTEAGTNGLKHTAFFNAFGPSYIQRALEEARQHAPDASLLINDYGFEYGNSTEVARRRAFLALLEQLVSSGAPIDGVGLQAHLDLSKGPLASREIRSFMRAIRELGLSVTITELDVKEADTNAPLAVRDQRVADEVQRYLDIALMEPAVRGVVTWGLSDRYSWLSESDGAGGAVGHGVVAKDNRGLPYDSAYQAKPMYWALLGQLQSSSKTGVAFEGGRAKHQPQAA